MRPARAPGVLLLAAVAAAACTPSSEPVETTSRARPAAGTDFAGPPRARPPAPRGRHAPPPAWLETRSGSVWLAHSASCWRGAACVDVAAPACGEGLPLVRARRGEPLRVHLGFRARRLTLRVGDSRHAEPLRRISPRTAEWRLRGGGGAAVLFARAARGGSASYAFCLAPRTPPHGLAAARSELVTLAPERHGPGGPAGLQDPPAG